MVPPLVAGALSGGSTCVWLLTAGLRDIRTHAAVTEVLDERNALSAIGLHPASLGLASVPADAPTAARAGAGK